VSEVQETVLPDATSANTWFNSPYTPAHLNINNGVDTPDDASYLFAGGAGASFTGGMATPTGTGYTRINKAKLRLRLAGLAQALPPGTRLTLYNDGNLLGQWTHQTGTAGVIKNYSTSELTGLDIAEADADKFTWIMESLNGAPYDPPDFES
jgi:hypothetical protein